MAFCRAYSCSLHWARSFQALWVLSVSDGAVVELCIQRLLVGGSQGAGVMCGEPLYPSLACISLGDKKGAVSLWLSLGTRDDPFPPCPVAFNN